MAKGKSKESSEHAWHSDFRIRETLPDVKVVRTDFVINFITITLAVLLGGYFCYRQVFSWDLKSRISGIETTIEQDTPKNRVNLKNSAEFKRSSKKIEDLSAFYSESQPPLDLVVELAASRPDYIALSRIEFARLSRPISKTKNETYNRYQIYGVLQGSSAEALDALNKYKEIVNNLEFFDGKIDTINVPRPSRNPTLDLFEFNIVIILKPNGK